MFGIGTPEILIIIVVALLIFGPSKLPELGKTLGKGIREFKKASTGLRGQMNPLNEEEHNADYTSSAPPDLIEEKAGKKPAKRKTTRKAAPASINKTATIRPKKRPKKPKTTVAQKTKTKTAKQK
ncbi:MAG: twin-arginine translocase TatA/TatE family subunit [Deltaproteobacteria bacterium]|nr:twin-arginine translocase TatA/TatE family subunit [Deltaproteobacteria bacterium]